MEADALAAGLARLSGPNLQRSERGRESERQGGNRERERGRRGGKQIGESLPDSM